MGHEQTITFQIHHRDHVVAGHITASGIVHDRATEGSHALSPASTNRRYFLARNLLGS
jgi:hypothetical protein